jgi:hypothetical protein
MLGGLPLWYGGRDRGRIYHTFQVQESLETQFYAQVNGRCVSIAPLSGTPVSVDREVQ